jgi:hypothetical protein
MKKLLVVFLLIAMPAMAQNIGQNVAPTYQIIKTPTNSKSVVVVNTPRSCNPPQDIVGKSINQIEGMQFNQPVRIIHPGEMITSDYNDLRIDIMLDENGIIQNVHCG